ncbi:hypothetical protein QWY79_11700 [Halomonas sabkhae]|uniref:hypothetical protein n=1 Tax=Halomonas sabkhae TaxID=626223 RepID=UPI0025B497DE|nr:hypothetical protein [Halomonas sabkhae]MDN3525926.1 hypothetical protein [Halomonas sabkhae]
MAGEERRVRRKKEEGRRKKEEGRRKKEEGRRKKEEGRRKKEGSMTHDGMESRFFLPSSRRVAPFFPLQAATLRSV